MMGLPPNLITGKTARLPTDLALPPLPKIRVLSPEEMLGLLSGEVLGERHDQPGRIILRLNFAAMGKPRMTQRDKWAKRPCVLRYREWCDKVRAVAGDIPAPERIAAVNWTAWFEPPKSWPKSYKNRILREKHDSKPDKDNIEKAIFDCLWPWTDHKIGDGRGTKMWGTESRLEIEIVLECPKVNP